MWLPTLSLTPFAPCHSPFPQYLILTHSMSQISLGCQTPWRWSVHGGASPSEIIPTSLLNLRVSHLIRGTRWLLSLWFSGREHQNASSNHKQMFVFEAQTFGGQSAGDGAPNVLFCSSRAKIKAPLVISVASGSISQHRPASVICSRIFSLQCSHGG